MSYAEPMRAALTRRARSHPRDVRSRTAAGMAALALAALLAGCGFHLRGEANYPFQSLYLNAASTVPFTVELKRSIESSGSTELAASPAKAQVILDIESVRDDKQILSLSSGGKVAEYLLTKRVVLRVRDNEGNEWLPTTEVVIRRTYTYNDTDTLAKSYEEQRLLHDMQADAVQQIVRRLEAAKKPVA